MNTYQISNRLYTHSLAIRDELSTSPTETYLCPLDQLICLSIKGEQAAHFLQGQLSCDVRKVDSKHYQTGLYCSLKGRIIAIVDVIYCHDFQLLIEKDIADKTIASLKTAAMLSKVSLSKATRYQAIGIVGPVDTLGLSISLPKAPGEVCQNDDMCLYQINPNQHLLLLETSSASSILANHNDKIRGSLLWHYQNLQENRPAIYPETQGLFLPHRLSLHQIPGIINLEKGCFKGQEIIARTHYRAKLKHHYQTYISEQKPALTEKIYQEDQECGEVIDWCPMDDNQFLIACSIKR